MVDGVDPELERLMAEMKDWRDVEAGTDDPECQYGGQAAQAWEKAIDALLRHHPYFIKKEAEK